MDILLSTLILSITVLLSICLSIFHDRKTSSLIPYITTDRYPVVGHLFAFLTDRTRFVTRCRQQYGQCFSIRLMTQRITFLLSPSDWKIIIRNRSFYFPGPEFATKTFGISPNCFGHSEMDRELHQYYKQYLQGHDSLGSMMAQFVHQVRKVMMREKTVIENSGTGSKWISSGLLELSHRILFEPSTRTLFGEIDLSSLESDFRIFDANIHYFIALLPGWIYRWFFRRELEARSRLNSSWLKDRHPRNECGFIQARTTFIFDHPEWFCENDFAGAQTALLWASLGNTIPAVFWCLFYILRDAKAVESIKQEIDTHLPAFSLVTDDRSLLIEEWTPARFAACVYLDSAVNETLRLVGAPMMLRKCSRGVRLVLHDKRTLNVKPDEAVSLFPAATHYDENHFRDPMKFIFDRFVHKNVDTIAGFLPFGAGKSMCPGRFFARDEIKICVAMVLRYMECKLVDFEPIPTQKAHRIGVGVAPPEHDLTIMFRYKEEINLNVVVHGTS